MRYGSHRALTGIMDDYFEGYFSEEMIESQVFFILLLPLIWKKRRNIYVRFLPGTLFADDNFNGLEGVLFSCFYAC